MSKRSAARRLLFPLLFGGQGGWLNGANFLDQVPLWLFGDHIDVPLRLETVQNRFGHVTELRS